MTINNISLCYKLLLCFVLAGLGSTFNTYLIATGHCLIQSIYMGFILGAANPVAGDDAKEVRYFSLADLPPLAFDHADMIKRVTG